MRAAQAASRAERSKKTTAVTSKTRWKKMPDAQFDLVESYDTAPQSDWFHACREAEKPYVVVRTSEKTADVMWDYVTLPPSYDPILMANQNLLKEQVIAIFQKHASIESSVRAKATVVFFDNLKISKAKLAANELYTLIESLVENPAQSTDADTNQRASLAAFAAPKPEKKPSRSFKQAPPPTANRQQDGGVDSFELIATG
jgi:hypothetical protein